MEINCEICSKTVVCQRKSRRFCDDCGYSEAKKKSTICNRINNKKIRDESIKLGLLGFNCLRCEIWQNYKTTSQVYCKPCRNAVKGENSRRRCREWYSRNKKSRKIYSAARWKMVKNDEELKLIKRNYFIKNKKHFFRVV